MSGEDQLVIFLEFVWQILKLMIEFMIWMLQQ